MSQRNRRAARLLMFGGLLLTVVSFADTARADLVLVVTDPAHNGLTASNMNTVVFSPATSGNPTRVMLGGLRGNMHQVDDQLVISLEADEPGNVSTSPGPENPFPGSIPVQIQGTSGEAAGTPVTLHLESSLSGSCAANSLTDLFINGTNYAPNQPHVIHGLAVGDTFRYRAGLSQPSGSATFIPILTVQPVPGAPAPIPEPAAMILLATGVLALGARLTPRRLILTDDASKSSDAERGPVSPGP